MTSDDRPVSLTSSNPELQAQIEDLIYNRCDPVASGGNILTVTPHVLAWNIVKLIDRSAAPVPPVAVPDKLQKFEGFMLADGGWLADTWTFDPSWDKRRRRFHQRGHGDDPVAALIDALRSDAAKAGGE